MTVCAIDDCAEKAISRGWCEPHYRRWLHHGDPLAGGPFRDVLSNEELADRMHRGLDQVRNPVALAHKYLAKRRLLGGPDHDDLVDVAIQAVVDAAMSWEPDGGRSITSWAYLYMDKSVNRELGRCVTRREELELVELEHESPGHARWALPLTDACAWLRFDPGTDPYQRAELRVDLQRWADLAELTPLMRFLVEYAALHLGAYVRDTPLAARATPLHDGGYASYKNALGHMRRAAVTGERRADGWTRMKARRAAGEGGLDWREIRSNEQLAEMRADEAWRLEVIAAGAAAHAVPDDDLAETG